MDMVSVPYGCRSREEQDDNSIGRRRLTAPGPAGKQSFLFEIPHKKPRQYFAASPLVKGS